MIKNEYLNELITQKYQSMQSDHLATEFFNDQKLLEDDEYRDVFQRLNAISILLERAIFDEKRENIKILENEKKRLEETLEKIENRLNVKSKTVYACNDCKDKGETEKGLCHCYYKNLTSLAYNMLNIKEPTLHTFDEFVASDEKEEALLVKFKNYAKKFDCDSKNLVFLSGTGTGKTFTAQAIANEVAKKNFNVLFLTANEFNTALLNFHLAELNSKQLYVDILTTCDLLVIDDLGAEPIYANVTVEHILFVISSRLTQKKPFIITTNLTEEDIKERYTERLLSRLTQKSTRLVFSGKDKRTNL